MKEITWRSHKRRGRSAWLLLIKGNNVVAFDGAQIQPGVEIRDRKFELAGSTYRLLVANDTRVIRGWNGRETDQFNEGLREALKCAITPNTWKEYADVLGVSVPSVKAFMEATDPYLASMLDQVERELKDRAQQPTAMAEALRKAGFSR